MQDYLLTFLVGTLPPGVNTHATEVWCCSPIVVPHKSSQVYLGLTLGLTMWRHLFPREPPWCPSPLYYYPRAAPSLSSRGTLLRVVQGLTVCRTNAFASRIDTSYLNLGRYRWTFNVPGATTGLDIVPGTPKPGTGPRRVAVPHLGPLELTISHPGANPGMTGFRP